MQTCTDIPFTHAVQSCPATGWQKTTMEAAAPPPSNINLCQSLLHTIATSGPQLFSPTPLIRLMWERQTRTSDTCVVVWFYTHVVLQVRGLAGSKVRGQHAGMEPEIEAQTSKIQWRRESDKLMTSLTRTVDCSWVDSTWSSMVYILVLFRDSGTVKPMKKPSSSLDRRIRLLLNSSCDEPSVQTLLMLQVYVNLYVSGNRIPRITCSCSSRAKQRSNSSSNRPAAAAIK